MVEDGPLRHAAPAAEAPLLHRGTNQSGMRDQNERLVLSLVRRSDGLSKTEISRMTGLSAQTVSVIMRELEHEGLLLRQAPQRGKVGQPSIPMALNPEGAFFIGLKIGRRSAELVLTDFMGSVRGMRQNSYHYPAPGNILDFVEKGVGELRAGLASVQDRRIAGLGIAMPFELWNWADKAGAPRDVREQWRHRDIRGDIQALYGFPVYLLNDATAACGAELVFGRIGNLRDFIYFYIGAFAGGGVVLNGQLYSGPTGNAGALGSMPVPGAEGRPTQLIDVASLTVLEAALNAGGMDASYLWTSPDRWHHEERETDTWCRQAGGALAYAAVAAASVIDFEAVLIDGWMPTTTRQKLVAATREAMAGIDAEGLRMPLVMEGTVGIHARALGAASLPLSERFLIGPATTQARM